MPPPHDRTRHNTSLARKARLAGSLPALARVAALALLSGGLAACTTSILPIGVGRPAPPGAPPGTCWETVILPAHIETVTQQVMVSPPVKTPDGQILSQAVFHTETHQEITRPREESFFETPCPRDYSVDYIASLQRALKARKLYAGEITGLLTRNTRNAIRAYQVPLGIDSSTLSLQAARALGLSAVPR